jgi:hypothetical protein
MDVGGTNVVDVARASRYPSGITMFALTDHAALIIASATPAVITGSIGLVILKRQRRVTTAINQINTAVNHQDVGAPTLVERVIALETHMHRADHRHVDHTAWLHTSMCMIAKQVGCVIEPAPAERP